jgi:hypothetical protein
VGCGRIRKI